MKTKADNQRLATDLQVRNRTEPGLMAVGGVTGLYLQIMPRSGSKSWILRATVGSKRRDLGLGGYPTVSLAEARTKAQKTRQQILEGVDPVVARQTARNSLIAEQERELTFSQATGRYISAKGDEWRNPKHRQQWAKSLETYAGPVIGKMHVKDIHQEHVLKILGPIWTTKTTTASRIRGRIESVLDWATTRGYRDGLNPARWRGHLDTLLPTPSKIATVKHHKALAANEMHTFMQALRQQDGMGALALEFVILTAARSGEVRGGMWSEIDLDAATWTIPAERMKAGRQHRVPLSHNALEILKRLPYNDGPGALIFPGNKGKPLSDMTLTAVTRRMGIAAVPHGFRSTFRDWVSESTSYPHDVAEMALAHTIANKVEAAYRRGDLFDKRRKLMVDWANFLNTPPISATVIPITKAAKA